MSPACANAPAAAKSVLAAVTRRFNLARRPAETARPDKPLMTNSPMLFRSGSADLIALAREALRDPYWAHHAAEALSEDQDYKW